MVKRWNCTVCGRSHKPHVPFCKLDIPTKLIAYSKDDADLGCRVWTGGIKGSSGYGNVWDGEKSVSAHRLSYETFVGPIPDGMHIDHLCRNRSCIKPSHLDVVTNAENAKRGLTSVHNMMKTYCPAGHPYSGANLYVLPSGSRACKECSRERGRAYRLRLAAAR
jgi:hypothetical protein